MNKTPNTTAGLAVGRYPSPAFMGRAAASPSGQPLSAKHLMRRYEVAHLTPSKNIEDFSKIAPAMPVFEDAFAAFGRGAILRTQSGMMAVEDLLPGDEVLTDLGYQTLLWHGSMSIMPGARNPRPEIGTMTRITADALGFGRPAPDLVLGPAARILHRSPATRVLTGTDTALVPVRDFIDGEQLIELRPIAPVRCYQLGFAQHACVNVNGIDVETLHPGPAHAIGLGPDLLPHLMAMFPHMRQLTDFGPLTAPRLRKADIDLVMAA